ncbi:hypothetical protein ACOMHN_049567 [Nucella lapillus]
MVLKSWVQILAAPGGGWLLVVELAHFSHLLVTGRSRFVEAVFCGPQALVYTSEEWQRLREVLPGTAVTGMRSFLEACVNQALGGVGKKKKSGGMKLTGDATIAEICASFRLLHHAHNHHLGLPPVSNGLTPSKLPDCASAALDKLIALYKDPEVSKDDIFQCLVTWHKQLKDKMKTCAFTEQQKVTEAVGRWMKETRLQGRVLPPVVGPEDSNSRLSQLMQEIGGPLTRLAPEQLLLVARAGSLMYGLSTPESDVDYVVIFREKTEVVLSACNKVSECLESRGLKKTVEYGAYEARMLCEMLMKCSVVMLEKLHDHRDKFVTELAIQQYLGLIKNNFGMINRQRCTHQERKLFYQASPCVNLLWARWPSG